MQSELASRALKKRMSEYFRQRLDDQAIERMSDYAAVTFRPGGHLDSFEGNLIRRAGVAVLVTVRYEPSAGRAEIPVEAFGSETRSDGTVCRSVRELRLSLDLHRRPRAGARGRSLDPVRSASLFDTALRLDHRCQMVQRAGRRPQSYVIAPPVLLGFATSRPPAFEDTPALRQAAAWKLGVREDELGRNGSVLLDRLLREVWESSQLPPDSPENQTGNLLVPASFCPAARGFLTMFEDFREFVGVPAWNPARDVRFATYENPATGIWYELGFGDSPNFDQSLSAETLAELERRMREELTGTGVEFTQEDIYEGLTSPGDLLIAWSDLLPRLRRKLPSWAESCCTDADLKAAVRYPDDPLCVRYACCVQVVHRDALAHWLDVPMTENRDRDLQEASKAKDLPSVSEEVLGIAG